MTDGPGTEDNAARDDAPDPGRRPKTAEATRRGNVYLLPNAAPADLAPAGSDELDPQAPGAGPGAAREPDAVDDRGSAQTVGTDQEGDPLQEREDWAWVQEWRDGREPTPWSTGLVISVFSALVVGVAVWVLSAGLSDRPVVAIGVNLLVAAGLAPAIWLSRALPVLRWIAAGAAAGIVVGWLSALMMLPMPAP